ncbi:2-like [Dorcoceras hygrometricum]|uniref:2-like n=1 Tax=Dorcoceras hygrometricum TaxID=472368 RepID=A0A2Z7DD85_9LAMI|nr:2-like [Dorcoceras hygrometricum]
MASSFYSNAQHVDFESVLGMDDHGMVSMFEALMASGLRGFLGCPAVVYEDALVDFFENASVRSGVIISTVGAGSFNAITVEKFSLITAVVCRIKMNWAKFLFSILKKMVSAGSKQAKGFAIQISLLLATFHSLELGESSEFPASKVLTKKTVLRFVSINDRDGAEEVTGAAKKKAVSKKRSAADVGAALVEISEELFVESFELPVDGLGDLSEMPKDAIFDARSIISLSGEPISLSGRKNQMKMPFRLLCDIMAKAISVKAGSFNAITVEKFSLITAVVCKIKMNWAKFLFSILKKMVSAGSKQAKGFAIQISLLLANFPSLELGESSEFPASKVLTKKTVLRFVSINDRDGAEEVTGAAKKKAVSKKRSAADVGAAVPKKKRSFKKKSVSYMELVEVAEEAIPIQQVAEPLDVEEPRCSSADAVDLIIQQVLDETRAADAPADIAQPSVTEEKHWFDLPYDDLVKQWEAERPVVTASDTDEDLATVEVAPADGVQQVEEFVAPISVDDTLSADEQMSLDDILLTIPVDIPLPSSCMEITKITMGKSIKIPGVSNWTWFLKSLPRIPAGDKGKEFLVEKDPVKGNPAAEHYSLICADIELLVNLRAQVIDEVASFFHSFSLKKLATINFEEMYRKEEQVLSWGETESPQEAIQRKFYILLKYRTVLVWKFLDAWRANFVPGQGSSAVDIQVIELLSDLYLSFLEELAKEARAHNLIWNKPCCSKIFEGSPRDRGAVIARTNSNTRSLCWITKMILVDGMWTVELCADKWVKIPRKVISTEISRQRQFDDTLPSMSVFFMLMKKRWADVCLEVTDFCGSRRLLPVGSINFCRDLEIVETDSCFASRQPTVFSLRLSQFCTIHLQYSLFSSLSTADISEFLSSIALDRAAFRSVQIAQSVVPSVQLSLDHRPSSPISPESSSSLRFDQTDIDATASSVPPISQDLSAAFADLQANLLEQIFDYQSGLSSKLHKIEQSVCDSLRDQADIFKNLSQGSRQEVRTLDDVQSIRFNEFRKTVLAQNASIFQGLVDVRHEVEAVNAKVDIMASRFNAIQKDAEATKEALSHQLLEFQSSAQENHNVIHAQLSELVDYIHRGSADKKGESGSRGLQQPASTQIEGSAVTPSFAQRVEMAKRRIVHTVLDADRDTAERDRERRRKEASAAAAARRRSSPEICSGQFDVESPIVLISSGLLVQSDEGVSDLVVDRIDVTTAINREAPGS